MALRFSVEAENDLGQIWSYVSEKSASISIADHLIDSITEHCYLLASRPYLGRDRNPEFGFQSRSFAVGEYVIVYSVMNTDVLIARVVHGRRDLEALFGR
jgi:toxin ParE1/3/4